ncbi:threonine/homoserine/homoserine lactone efflux protein [Providencia alcalifaciens]|nr:threonine/homoserine/homoserine lactone efflux protein [Providencia alcalifaciens]
MITTLISSFLTYTLITALTLGPNNILAMSSVIQYGFRRSIGVIIGMSLGFLVIMILCAVFTLSLVIVLLVFIQWLSWIGAAYILWLVWKIAKSQISSSSSIDRPMFLGELLVAVCQCEDYFVSDHCAINLCITLYRKYPDYF